MATADDLTIDIHVKTGTVVAVLELLKIIAYAKDVEEHCIPSYRWIGLPLAKAIKWIAVRMLRVRVCPDA